MLGSRQARLLVMLALCVATTLAATNSARSAVHPTSTAAGKCPIVSYSLISGMIGTLVGTQSHTYRQSPIRDCAAYSKTGYMGLQVRCNDPTTEGAFNVLELQLGKNKDSYKKVAGLGDKAFFASNARETMGLGSPSILLIKRDKDWFTITGGLGPARGPVWIRSKPMPQAWLMKLARSALNYHCK